MADARSFGDAELGVDDHFLILRQQAVAETELREGASVGAHHALEHRFRGGHPGQRLLVIVLGLLDLKFQHGVFGVLLQAGLQRFFELVLARPRLVAFLARGGQALQRALINPVPLHARGFEAGHHGAADLSLQPGNQHAEHKTVGDGDAVEIKHLQHFFAVTADQQRSDLLANPRRRRQLGTLVKRGGDVIQPVLRRLTVVGNHQRTDRVEVPQQLVQPLRALGGATGGRVGRRAGADQQPEHHDGQGLHARRIPAPRRYFT